MLKPHDRLRIAREQSGKTAQDLANAAGISVPHYYDLEAHDDELFMTLSLRELRELCQSLAVSARYLFANGPRKDNGSVVSFVSIAAALSGYLREHKVSQDAFENKIGWSLGSLAANPELAWEWNVDCLRDVCSELQIDWMAALPS